MPERGEMDSNRRYISAPCGRRVGIRPFAALAVIVVPVNWAFATSNLVLGGVAPPDSPVRLGCISPGQGLVRTDGGIRRPHDLE